MQDLVPFAREVSRRCGSQKLGGPNGNRTRLLAVTVRNTNRYTIEPNVIVKHRECQFRSPALTVPKPMQLYQDQSPAAVTRIVLASQHDTLSMLDYNINHIEALSTAGLGGDLHH